MVYRKRKSRVSLSKAVNRILARKVEVKKSTIVNTATITTTGAVIPLMEIAQGISHDQRIANSVDLLSFYVRVQTALGDAGYNRNRCAIVKTRNQYDPLQGLSQFFENTSFVTFGSVSAGFDFDFVERVLMDKTTVLNQLVANQRMTKYWKRYIKVTDKLHYNDSATAPPLENYYLILASDSAVLPHPTMNLVLTQRFTDQ